MIDGTADGRLQAFQRPDGSLPCFRCGECCRRWQPLIQRDELEALAAFLGVTPDGFVQRYTRPYPLDDRRWMVAAGPHGCIFHRYEDGLSVCSVYPARPRICREWPARLDQRECREGLDRLGVERALAVLADRAAPPGAAPDSGGEPGTAPRSDALHEPH
jgi:Fe-S-cluster containining protein